MKKYTLYLLMTAAFISFSSISGSGAAQVSSSTTAAAVQSATTSAAQATSGTAVGRGLDKLSQTVNTTADVGRGLNTISNTSASASSVKSSAQAADQVASGIDKLTGSETAKAIKDTTSQITSGATDFNSTVDAFNTISNTGLSTSSVNSAAKGLDTISSTFDKWAGTKTSDDIGKLTGDVSKITGDISKTMASANSISNEITSLINQGQSVKDIINDPQAMLQMAFGMVDFQTIANALADYAVEEAFNYIEPSTGWPVSSQEMKTQKGLEKAEKKVNAELDDKISKEKEKQVDAMGARPETPAPQQTGTQQPAKSTEQNPAADDCRAYMAQFKDATHTAFDYVNENLIKEAKKSTLGAPQKDYDTAVEYVKRTFYHDDPKTITPAIEEKIKQARLDYLQEINTNVMSLGIGVQQAILEDAKSISTAPTSGCSFIDDMNVNTKTLSTIIKQTMADLALQIRLLELEAVKEQATQPISLLPKPEKTQEGQ